MRKYLIHILKVAIPSAIICWLVASIDAEQWHDLTRRHIDWSLLSAAFLLEFFALCLTFVRWYWLVRVLGISFSLADAFRLSFLGYLFNFVSVGSVGGDLFKAFFIAREQPGRRTEAVASVVVDRVVGMYALMLVASGAILLGGLPSDSPVLTALCRVTLLATLIVGAVLVAAMIPALTEGRVVGFLTSLRKIGPILERLVVSLRAYRSQKLAMTGILSMSMLVHGILTLAVFLIAKAVFGNCPPLIDHLVIVPMSMVAGALPFTPSGLGSFEFAMDELFRLVSPQSEALVSGVLIALVYRLVTIAIAAVGVVYYWACPVKVPASLGAEMDSVEVAT
ncbi:MAG: lysylphosphatidylglycerol synthase transmembrane domain-containing protein [Pirellulaceae bacterium]